MAHPNEERLRSLYTSLATGDIASAVAMLADDAVFHVPGRGQLAGEHRGKDEIVKMALRAFEETQGTFKTEPIAIFANDSYAVGLHKWTAKRGGKSIAMNNFNVYRFDSVGKITERWEFIEDQESHDDFWS